ncbi:HAD family hydrolase [Castellaniella sp.]|uniref:HAD family hydrolase n=1 Tax=Castellaniella sp. TaxID=1955812 RepID=UPI003A9463DC
MDLWWTPLAFCKEAILCLWYELRARVRRRLPGLDAYILSFEVGVAKPDPAIYEAVCAALGCSPCEALFIGDSRRSDDLGPRAFGMPAHWLDRASG